MRIAGWIAGLVAVQVAGAGCREGGSPVDPGPGGGDSPAITVTVSPAALTLPQGGSGTLPIVITRSGGFLGDVALAVEGVPAGLVVTLAPATVPAGGSAAELRFSAGGTVAAGSYTLTLRATGDGIAQKSVSISVTITAVTTPGFTVAVAPSALSIEQSSAATAEITVTRVGGFTGTVDLSVSGAPAGVNASISPASVLVTPATLTVGATFNAAPGSYTLTIRATASGLPERTLSITVTVTPANPSGNVAWQFCAASGLPVWFAYQDGSGPWTRLSPVNDVYAFDLLTGRGGVAWVTTTVTGGYALTVTWGILQELNTQGQRLCAASRQTKTVNGSVQNVGPSEQAWISFGGAFTSVVAGVPGTFTLSNVLDGTFDLLASRIALGPGGALTLNRLILRRALNPANGSTLQPLDFNGSESFDPVGQSITMANRGADETRIVMSYYAGGRSTGAYFADAASVASDVRVFPAVPASRQASSDLHVLTLVTTPPGTATPAATRSATVLFRDAADQYVSLGPALGPVTVSTPAASPYARLRAQYPVQTTYNSYWTFDYSQPAGGSQDRHASLAVTAAYFAAFSSVDLTMPDFSGVPGWDPNWAPRPGTSTDWTFTASGWLASGGITGPPWIDGTQAFTATRSGTITP